MLDSNVDSVDSLIDFISEYLNESDYTVPIYYEDAIDILKIRDPSLKLSLELASDMDMDLKSVDSTVLASLVLRDDCNSVLFSEEFRQGLEEIFADYSEQ